MKINDLFKNGQKLELDKSALHCLDNGSMSVSFLESGDIFEITHGYDMINQMRASTVSPSYSTVYLRVYGKSGDPKVFAMSGMKSSSKVNFAKDGVCFSGTAEGISYLLRVVVAKNDTVYYNVTLEGVGTCDLLYVQDLGVGNKGGVLTNELYTSQYLGHCIFRDKSNGHIICSRQGLAQDNRFPYTSLGAIGIEAEHYCTDAMQFFGTSYKTDNRPALLAKDLPDVNYQYELANIALQTKKITLNGRQSAGFFLNYIPTVNEAVIHPIGYEEILSEYSKLDFSCIAEGNDSLLKLKDSFGEVLFGETLKNNDIDNLYSQVILAETDSDGKLLSFFTKDHAHVALKEKEAIVERPHGNIITTAFKTDAVPENLLTTTNYSYGLFNSQTVCGNTSNNKFLSTNRGLLNIIKSTGQRIYVKIDGKFRLLALPSAFEMGLNYSRWLYKTHDDLIDIKVFTVADSPKVELKLTSKKQYEFIVTNQLVLGGNEFENPVLYSSDGDTLVFTANKDTFTDRFTPFLKYKMTLSGADFSVSDDRIFFDDNLPRNGALVTLTVEKTSEFSVLIGGTTKNEEVLLGKAYDFEREKRAYLDFYDELLCGLNLNKSGSEEIEKLNQTIYWYAHNAMVHFAVPHGLEQPGGAAWGTRDVCQGPMEFFIMTGNFAMARKILLTLFSHQLNTLKEWGQWFMFDNYPIGAGECHGDIVFWPLMALSAYLNASGDIDILSEQICYKNGDYTNSPEKSTLLEHVYSAVKTISERFIDKSGHITYAGGDWDDTLQPVIPELKENLISSWTMALAYQTAKNLSEAVKNADVQLAKTLALFAEKIKTSFTGDLIKDGVIAGFGYNNEGKISLMLHPDDKFTGINYRLLPMTRSIIAELVTPQQAKKNVSLIDEHLACPDGVRLMNSPARYEGGVSKIFTRAETAANVGREVSLQYVHAHIRYIEAMAKLGEAQRAWDGLFVINPIKITSVVKNAVTRQSNAYFSSSDGLFNDRYEYKKNFHKLRDGSVPVRGGWRIYSSGGGIYLNRLVSDILGLNRSRGGIMFDPVLPLSMDKLRVSFRIQGKTCEINYNVARENARLKSVQINGKEILCERGENLYREGGIFVPSSQIDKLADGSVITLNLE